MADEFAEVKVVHVLGEASAQNRSASEAGSGGCTDLCTDVPRRSATCDLGTPTVNDGGKIAPINHGDPRGI
jgi:hypothetical protein